MLLMTVVNRALAKEGRASPAMSDRNINFATEKVCTPQSRLSLQGTLNRELARKIRSGFRSTQQNPRKIRFAPPVSWCHALFCSCKASTFGEHLQCCVQTFALEDLPAWLCSAGGKAEQCRACCWDNGWWLHSFLIRLLAWGSTKIGPMASSCLLGAWQPFPYTEAACGWWGQPP